MEVGQVKLNFQVLEQLGRELQKCQQQIKDMPNASYHAEAV